MATSGTGRTGALLKADKGPDEEERLASLRSYEILDTGAEAEFDEITRVVSEVCNMPVSLISLVDTDRQWFKAKTGVDLRETPLEASVCAHGILQSDVFEIEDLTKDIRTVDNPLVTGAPHARFYAGAPITNDEGRSLGMLCVLDYQPRKLAQAQRDLLRIMSRLVVRQMELRKILRTERAAHTLVQDVLAKANVLLERNDTLRREIDHRVKNSLAQVAGFLAMQERSHREEPLVARPLADARNRVMAVVQVHDHLHRSAEDDKASVKGFLSNLAHQVSQNRPPQLQAIRVVVDDTKMPSDKVMAIGLIVNEFISNVMKHAFEPGMEGVIDISFRSDGNDHVLRLADNGRGVPPNFDINSTKGLGLRVMNSLAQQLGGTYSQEDVTVGAAFLVRFPASCPAP